MALVKCWECGCQISDHAVVCPHCGFPYNSGVKPSEQKADGNFDLAVSKLLLDFGIPVYLLGYEYLHYALVLCMQEPYLAHAITVALYPAVAEKFKTSKSKVERAIRYSLEIAWNAGNNQLQKCFPLFRQKGKRPSNGAFIAAIANQLQMERKQQEKVTPPPSV